MIIVSSIACSYRKEILGNRTLSAGADFLRHKIIPGGRDIFLKNNALVPSPLFTKRIAEHLSIMFDGEAADHISYSV